MSKEYLLIIDPQIDFCAPNGKLSIPGADKDCERIAAFIEKKGKELDRIVVTLDTHRVCDIAHPCFWTDEAGKHVAPYTFISLKEVKEGKYRATLESDQARAVDYLTKLEAQGKSHIVWPEHCILGTAGHAVMPVLMDQLEKFERETCTSLDYIIKGMNKYTENFSALKAEVVDPEDPATNQAKKVASLLDQADKIYVTGEAASHCLSGTIRDLIAEKPSIVKKLVLIKNMIGCVAGFEDRAADFYKEMNEKGATIVDSL